MGLLDLCLTTVLFILQQIDVRTLHPIMSQLNAPLDLQLPRSDQIVPRPIQLFLDWLTSHPTWVKIQPLIGSYDLLWHLLFQRRHWALYHPPVLTTIIPLLFPLKMSPSLSDAESGCLQFLHIVVFWGGKCHRWRCGNGFGKGRR